MRAFCTLVCARTTGVLCLCMPWNLHIDLLYLNPTHFHSLYQPVRARIKIHLFNISYPSPLWLYSACAVTLSYFGHFNRSCLLTHLQDCTIGLTFKIYTSTHPTIRPTILQFRTSARHLSSRGHCLLHVFHDCFHGQDCFSAVGRIPTYCYSTPTIWNSLPADLTDNSNGEWTSAPWQLPPRTTALMMLVNW